MVLFGKDNLFLNLYSLSKSLIESFSSCKKHFSFCPLNSMKSLIFDAFIFTESMIFPFSPNLK